MAEGGAAEGGTRDLGIAGLTGAVEVGRGGFAVVYRCTQPSFGRTVAVKVLRGAVGDDRARMRFQRECLAMGMLSGHPNIVTVYEAGFLPDGDPYIVMDFMGGGSLADVIAQHGPMPAAEVLRSAVMLAGALESAHRSGVLHRDIKPENSMRSSYGSVKLTDFGIARLRGGPETRTEGLTASIPHVAPELLTGAPASVQSDLYAIGSTMFHLLSGETAFIRPTDESLLPALTRITSEPVPDLRQRGVRHEICEVVEQLMAKDPDARPASAEELGRRLQGLQQLFGVPVTEMAVQIVAPADTGIPDPEPRQGDDGFTRRGIPRVPTLTSPPSQVPTQPNYAPAPAAAPAGPNRTPLIALGALLLLALVGVGVFLATRPGATTGVSIARTSSEVERASEAGPTDPEPSASPVETASASPESSPLPEPRPPPVVLIPARTDATNTAPPGTDASGETVTYESDNLVDGRLDTAWRTPGSGERVEVTLIFEGPVYVESLGLVPGYAKVDPADGTDRFFQNRRIQRVLYSFSGGQTLEARFNQTPELQYVNVGFVTDYVLVEILETTRPGDRNFAAISEIEVLGSVER